MRTTRSRPVRLWVLLLLVLAATPATADAGGTAVLAPAELRPRECRATATPRVEGYRPPDLTVLGCIARGEREFLVAAEGADPFTCIYVVPEGGRDVDGVCRLPREGLDPLRFSAMTVARNRLSGRIFAWGLAQASEDGVTVVGTGPGGKDRRRHATLLRVDEPQARAIGMNSPFTLYLALTSSDSALCEGLSARRWTGGHPLSKPFKRGSQRFGSGIDLPGSPACR